MTTNEKNSGEVVRLDLTDAQKDQVKRVTGKDVESIELSSNELEERIAPRALS